MAAVGGVAGGLPRGGRGDPRGGRPRQGARGGCVRGARRRAPGRVPARAIRRARSPRCSRGWRPTTPPTCCSRSSRTAGCPVLEPAARSQAAQDQAAAWPQPVDRGRDDEPGLRLRCRRRHASPEPRCDACARSELAASSCRHVCLVDDDGTLVGTSRCTELIRADAGAELSSLLERRRTTADGRAEADLPEVALLMTDYNLVAMPGDRHRRHARSA